MLTRAELDTLRRRAAISGERLAGPETPFIRNAWYVAGASAEIGRALLSRTLLGQSILLYRTQAGDAVAMQNRCGHRSYPLSEGRLDGDSVICGYHGLRYGADGLCQALSDQSPARGRFGVRRFPTVERAPFVWVWPGDAELAEKTPLPHPDWLGAAGWDTQIGYALAKGSYVHLHENLLDLSHLTYLHAASFGTPEYAKAPVEITIAPGNIEAWRTVECVLPPVYAKPLGWEGKRARRRSGSQLVSPGLHVNTGLFENIELNVQPEPRPMVKVAQLITPETAHTTHYHYALCRNFALDDPETGAGMLAGLGAAFNEDLLALERMSAMQALAGADGGAWEFDIPTDRAGLEMRRRFKHLADEEASFGASAAAAER